MTLRRWVTPREDAGIRIDGFLRRALAAVNVSNSEIRLWIVQGWVRVDRRVERRPSFALSAGQIIELSERVEFKRREREAAQASAELSNALGILWEDADLIVVNKPSGLPTQATLDPRRPYLASVLKAQLANREGADIYLGMHHRLDVGTSGAVLFTRSKRANAGISDQFKTHQIGKRYVALVERRGVLFPTMNWKNGFEIEVRNHLGAVGKGKNSKQTRFGPVRAGGDPAITQVRILTVVGERGWVQAVPLTGRTHQIRVHLSGLGLEIVGDELYGQAPRGSRLALHAETLSFVHPLTKEKLEIRAPLPEDLVSLEPALPQLSAFDYFGSHSLGNQDT